jgi:hypothetical protein
MLAVFQEHASWHGESSLSRALQVHGTSARAFASFKMKYDVLSVSRAYIAEPILCVHTR